MKIYDTIKTALKNISDLPGQWTPIVIGDNVSTGKNFFHDKKLLEYFLGWQYLAIITIAESVAGINFVVRSKKDDSIVTQGKVYNAITKINNQDDMFSFFYKATVYLKLFGRVVIKKLNSPNEYFRIIPPQFVSIKQTNLGVIDEFIYKPSDKKQEKWSPDEVIYIYNIDPTANGRAQGLSQMNAFIHTLSSELASEKYIRRFFENDGTPGGLLVPKSANLTQSRRKRVELLWDKLFRGVDNAHKIGVMPYDFDYIQIAKTPKEADFIKTQVHFRDMILASFKVPKVLLGLTDGYNKATAQMAEYVYAKFTILPIAKQFKAALNEQFTRGVDDNVYIDFINPIPKDELAAETVKMKKLQYMTVNEVRALDGLGPIEGGDVVISLQREVNGNEVVAREDINNKIIKLESIIKTVSKNYNYMLKNLEIIKDKERARKVMADTYLQAQLVREANLKKDVQSAILELQSIVIPRVQNMFHSKSEEFVEQEEVWDKLIIFLTPTLLKIFEGGVSDAIAQGGDYVDIDADSDEVKNELEKYISMVTKLSSQTIADKINQTILEGLKAGDGIKELQDRLTKLFEFLSNEEAERIAITETTAFTNFGIFTSFKEMGYTGKGWLTMRDNRVRDAHAFMDGAEVPLDKPFIVNGVPMMYPGDFTAPAELRVNCRCKLYPVML